MGVYVHLPEPPRPRVHEPVRHAGRDDHDMAARHLYGVVPGGERGGAFLHDEDLLVGAPVQPRAHTRRCVALPR